MSSLNFVLAVICLFEARVPEVDTPPLRLDCRSVHCLTFWDSSFELAVYIWHKIQGRHLFADLITPHFYIARFKIILIASYIFVFMIELHVIFTVGYLLAHLDRSGQGWNLLFYFELFLFKPVNGKHLR